MGYSQAAVGVGLFLGPAFGSLVYSLAGYTNTFLIFGIVILLTVIPLYCFLSKELNKVE